MGESSSFEPAPNSSKAEKKKHDAVDSDIESVLSERHDSDEEELKRESKELRDYSDFFADAGGFLGDR